MRLILYGVCAAEVTGFAAVSLMPSAPLPSLSPQLPFAREALLEVRASDSQLLQLWTVSRQKRFQNLLDFFEVSQDGKVASNLEIWWEKWSELEEQIRFLLFMSPSKMPRSLLKLRHQGVSVWLRVAQRLRMHRQYHVKYGSLLDLHKKVRRMILAYYPMQKAFAEEEFALFWEQSEPVEHDITTALADFFHGRTSLTVAMLQLKNLQLKEPVGLYEVFTRTSLLKMTVYRQLSLSPVELESLTQPLVMQCAYLEPSQLDILITELASVWEFHVGYSLGWEKWPFSRRCYEQTTQGLAISERIAIAHFEKSGSKFDLLRLLDQRLANTAHTNLQQQHDHILDLYHYAEQNLEMDERFLSYVHRQLERSYYNSKLQQMVKKSLWVYLNTAVATARQKIAQGEALDLGYIALLRRQIISFSEIERVSNRHIRLSLELARLEVETQQLDIAVQDYDAIIQRAAKDLQQRTLVEKIKMVAKTCGWGMAQPWKNTLQTCPSQRSLLLRSMHHLSHLQQDRSWTTAMHIGMLNILSGRVAATQSYWTHYMELQPDATESSHALEKLISLALQEERWNDLKHLVEHAMRVGVHLPASAQLGSLTEIHEQSMAHIVEHFAQKKQWQTVVELLCNLIARYTHSAHKMSYLLSLADAYLRQDQPKLRLQTLQEVLAQPRVLDSRAHQEGLFGLVDIYVSSGQFEQASTTLHDYIVRYPQVRVSLDFLERMTLVSALMENKQNLEWVLSHLERLRLASARKTKLMWRVHQHLATVSEDPLQLLKFSQEVLKASPGLPSLENTAIYRLLESAWTHQDKWGLGLVEDFLYQLPPRHPHLKRWSRVVAVIRWASDMNTELGLQIREAGQDMALYPSKLATFVKQLEGASVDYCDEVGYVCQLYLLRKVALLKQVQRQFHWMALPDSESNHRTVLHMMIKGRLEEKLRLMMVETLTQMQMLAKQGQEEGLHTSVQFVPHEYIDKPNFFAHLF
ncbi:MAG: hypothetical protein OXT67_13125 [Zetaproteobacteria bacterium]|nr:hypothetical protein [Zetaproteobacteria bacterium]